MLPPAERADALRHEPCVSGRRHDGSRSLTCTLAEVPSVRYRSFGAPSSPMCRSGGCPELRFRSCWKFVEDEYREQNVHYSKVKQLSGTGTRAHHRHPVRDDYCIYSSQEGAGSRTCSAELATLALLSLGQQEGCSPCAASASIAAFAAGKTREVLPSRITAQGPSRFRHL